MKALLGTHDLLFVTLDTLRFDVAAQLLAGGRTPNLAKVLPGGQWQRRHTPASFTYAAHHAFFGGFLPTPAGPGPHPRPFAARFPGSTTVGEDTWEFDTADVVSGLRAEGYHTICIGGVGFFAMTSPQGSVLPGLFDEAHWAPEFGVTAPGCFEAQLRRLAAVQPAAGPLFTFINVAALHQPNRHYLDGAAEDSVASHGAALEYVDRHIPELLHLATGRGRPCHVIVCSDHGTAYGEDGHVGHRLAHEVVWTVPYAECTLEAGAW
ncbi:STM4013/SEN3800 family hydrolase [Dactylosporangium matsuzakiense]|uniref:Membrane protein n=1 Tax=Dactylosporangium matsuzakiense TaxID=53360 RepID=A0A9W6KL62_9ACTN|nr:STM4013/SEN3800 family hydrolase [Dactylosporangium matsuzakiense]UWZ43094.1 STM4013/SEN3800 family hydrolase [Dactylosporangium matsuzakiense]GLL02554.1 membrane protein [Dactylosporangium matsuzakiense]